jgi:benzodiazapine receptor
MTPGKSAALVVFLLVCFGTAALGSALTRPSLPTWYAALAKPKWNPPSSVFAPVWTTLFAMMAVAGWLVWCEQGRRPRAVARALVLFGVQLVLNVGWSWLFFYLRQPGLALIEVVVLWAAIAATILAFRRVSALATVLLVPYLLWVAFAAVLNLSLWRLNA